MTNDEQRFEELYQQHYREIERYVRRRVLDAAVSDMVAEIFTVAWRRLDDIPAGDARIWLYTVGRNVLANHARGGLRAQRLAERIAQRRVVDSEDHANEVIERLTMASAFDRLTEADQEILRLIAWEGLQLRQAAAVLGCGLPAAAMRLSRAKHRLRGHLQHASASEPSSTVPARANIRKGQPV
jgi:RNA polymerase sigma factor (sigma-70 family)